MKKEYKTAFDKFLLDEVQKFTDNTYVISAENTKEEFWKYFLAYDEEWGSEELETTKEEFMKGIKEDWVHFHYGVDDEDYGENKAMWWLSSKGIKGAKKVWTF